MARRSYRNVALAIVALLAYTVYAEVIREKAIDVSALSTQEIEEQLQVSACHQMNSAANSNSLMYSNAL